MKTNRIIYLVSTVLLSALFLFSAGMYLLNYPEIVKAFNGFGFPTWIIYPLAGAKIVGVLAMWIPVVPKWIKEWAYAGFFFDALLAIGAHLSIGDGQQMGAVIGLVLVIVSRHFWLRQDSDSMF